MILFQVTIGLNAAQTDTGAIQALVGGIVGGQANVTAGANTLSFTLAWDETLDGDFPSSLSFQFTGSGGNSLTFTSISINGQSVDLGTYLDNATINSGTQNGTITIGAPIRHFFGRQEPDVGNPVDIRNNPADALNTDLARPGDTTANVTIVPNVPQTAAIEGSSGRDIIYGSDFADRVNAGDGDDSVAGNNGGDTLYGGAGNDMIAGGAGDDTIFGGTGDDLIFGNAGADLIQGQGGNNVLNGGDGADTLVGGANNDILFGGADDDLISGGNGNDAMHGDDGDDLLSGGNGHDTGWGGAGNDTLAGGNGNDTLFGEADDDMLSGGAGADSLDGGAGADIMMGGDGADLIYGGLGNDVLLGEAGNDTLQGQDGDDVLIGGAGTDTLDGGAGADIIYGTSIDTATATTLVAQGGRPDVSFGMAGNSFYKVVLGSYTYAQALAAAAADTLNGVAGHLVVITSAAEQATVNELVAAAGGTGQFWMGASDTNPLVGEGGWIWEAGPENTQQFSNNSGTAYNGFLSYWQGGAPANSSGLEDYAALNADNNGYWTANASTATFGYIIEWDAGGMSADTGADVLTGGDGDDALYAGAGGTTVDGGNGNDRMYGGAGNDVFKGGAGVDYILAGGGVNTYDASTATGSVVTQNFFGANIMMGLSDGYGASNEILMGISNVIGGAYNDTLESLGGDNVLNGSGGTDLLTYATATAAVTVNLATTTAQNTGGSGSDTLSGFENLTGSAFTDMLTGNSGANAIDGGAGDDTIEGGSGDDVLTGGTGNDWLSYANAAAGIQIGLSSTSGQITGGAGTDTVSGFENLIGSAFNDSLVGNANANTIEGGAGDDTISGYAGSGTDTASYSTATGAVTVSLAIAGAQNSGSAGTDTLNSIQNLIGSAYGDTLTGDTGANTLSGGNGNDTLDGGTGDDTLVGGAGNDVITGGGGTDTVDYSNDPAAVAINLGFFGSSATDGWGGTDSFGYSIANAIGSGFNDSIIGTSVNNVLSGGAGDDAFFTLSGTDTVDGGTGNDTISYFVGPSAVTIDLGAGTVSASGHSAGLTSIENAVGSAGNDTIAGSSGSNVLNGSGGTDLLTYATATAAVTINLATTTAQNTGGAGTDTVTGFENLTGSTFADSLTGDSGANAIIGGDGNDTITGGSGADTLDGGAGHDVFNVANGDFVSGDSITGGSGTADTIVLTTTGTTADFSLGTLASVETIAATSGNDIVTVLATQYAGVLERIDLGSAGSDTYRVYVNGPMDISAATAATVSGSGTITGNLWGSGSDDSITLSGGQLDAILGGVLPSIAMGAGTDIINLTSNSSRLNVVATIGSGWGNALITGIEAISASAATAAVTLNMSLQSEGMTLIGGSGHDVITGGSANDLIDGGSGNDVLTGGNGTDTVTYANATASVTLSLATTTAQNTGGAGTDTVTGFENLTGSAFDDILTGNSAANVIDGGNGNDVFNVANGDFVSGDSITGGAGTADTIVLTTTAATADFSLGTLATVETITGTTGNDAVTILATHYAGMLSAVGLGAGSADTLSVKVSGTMDISAATAATISGVEFGYLVGTTGDDSLTITGAQLNAIMLSLVASIALGNGTDTLNLTSTSTRLNDLGVAADFLVSGVEAISAASAAAGVTISLTAQTEGFTLSGSGYADTLTGGAGNDTIIGGAGNDTLTGGDGNDIFVDGAGADELHGGNGTDTADYSSAAAGVFVHLNWFGGQVAIDESLVTLTSIENVIGSSMSDTLFGSSGANVIDGGAGNDSIEGGLGNDVLTGGTGIDTVSYATAPAGGVTVNLATTTAQNTGAAGTDTVSGFENLTGSNYNDRLTGDSGANTINGGNGDDTIDGGLGNDVLFGAAGVDTLVYTGTTAGIIINLATTTAQSTGGSGTQTVSGFENVVGTAFNDTLTGTTGDNTIDGGLGNDILTADTGTDTVVYTHATAGITINLATTTAQNTGGSGTDTISGFENLIGSAFNDAITGTTGDNIIDAGAGGNDVLTGGTGIDTVSYALSTAGVTVNLATTTAQNTGGNGTDTITGFENVTGSAFNDVLTSASADTLATQVSTILAANSGVSYDATTGNFYKFINSAVSWATANTAATSAQLTGVSGVYGHIAMPYSSYENNLLDTFTGLGTNQIWLGATDGVTEGTWLIAGGAMDGVALWIGTSGGAVQNSLWTNWNPGQPDNASNADHIGQNDGGLWEDRDPTNNRRYIIEWDGSQVLSPTSSTTLHGGAGMDSLYGAAGQDVFLFTSADGAIGTEANADKIYNFSRVQHDTINIADLLTGYTAGASDPDSWAKFEVSGSNVVLKVDADGGGTFGSSTVVATIMGTTDLTTFNIEHMVRDGFLVMG